MIMQKTKYQIIIECMMMSAHALIGQNETIEQQNSEYQRALDLFEKNKYASAQKAFKEFLNNKEYVSNDDYLADAYKIITFFLYISLLFIFLDLLPFPFFRNNDYLISLFVILLWVAYKFLFLSMVAKYVEKMDKGE